MPTPRATALLLALLLCGPLAAPAAAQDTAALRRGRDEFIRAEAYQQVRARDSAVAAYLRAVRAAPTAPFADSAEAQIRALSKAPAAPAPNPYAAAIRLDSLGMRGAALEQVKKVAAESPRDPVPSAVMAVVADSVGWWPTLRRRMDAGVRPYVEAFAVLVFLLAIPLLLLWLHFSRPRVEFGQIDATGVKAPSGQSFSAMVLQHIEKLTRGASSRGPLAGASLVVQGPVEGLPLPATVQAAIPAGWAWLQAVPALLERLSMRPRLRVTGQLHHPGRLGLGATLFITNRAEPVASHTVWDQDFRMGGPSADETETADASALAEATAVWLIFHLNSIPRRWFQRSAPAPRLFGTADWRSYALFRTGVRYAESGDTGLAERCYRRALARDGANRAARVNWAAQLIGRGQEARAIPHLQRVLRECGEDEDSVRFPALYRLAVALYHTGAHAPAESKARKLVEEIETGLVRSGGGKQPDLHAYLSTIREQACALHVGMQAKVAEDPDELQQLSSQLAEMDENAESAVQWFTLACCHWIVATRQSEGSEERRHSSNLALTAIDRACEMEPALVPRVAKDPTLKDILDDPEAGERATELVERLTVPPPPKPQPPEPTPQVVKLFLGLMPDAPAGAVTSGSPAALGDPAADRQAD